MGNYYSTHSYCEYCGLSLTPQYYQQQQKPHTIEECLAKLHILSKSIYDDYGQKVSHNKIMAHISRLSRVLESSEFISDEIGAKQEESRELGG